MLNNTTREVSKGSETFGSQLQKLDTKVQSCIDDLSRLDQFAPISDLKTMERAVENVHNIVQRVDKIEEEVQVTSKGQQLQQDFKEKFTEISRNIQEKGDMADIRINEALEQLQSQGKMIGMLNDATSNMSKGSETFRSQLQMLETKVQSCISDLASLDQYASISDLKTMESSVDQFHNLLDRMGKIEEEVQASFTSKGHQLQQSFKDEFSEISRNIQDKAKIADTRLNEALEQLQSHSRMIGVLNDTSSNVSKVSETYESQLQKLDTKVQSCIDDMACLDQFASISDLKNIERAVDEVHNLGERVGKIEEELKEVVVVGEEINDFREGEPAEGKTY